MFVVPKEPSSPSSTEYGSLEETDFLFIGVSPPKAEVKSALLSPSNSSMLDQELGMPPVGAELPNGRVPWLDCGVLPWFASGANRRRVKNSLSKVTGGTCTVGRELIKKLSLEK